MIYAKMQITAHPQQSCVKDGANSTTMPKKVLDCILFESEGCNY